ncbi:hypothetical protein NC651_016898 [Populus alba x Populus x berolinensis]|nr:hypothetical protein NC651_016898 [Populus alba x Populus x berolinensis]
MPPRYRDHSPPPTVVRVYTICDESRYLIVRNIPALGCGDDLFKLFASYGDVEECKPMDADDCEQFTDVYWIKFRLISNARDSGESQNVHQIGDPPVARVSSGQVCYCFFGAVLRRDCLLSLVFLKSELVRWDKTDDC